MFAPMDTYHVERFMWWACDCEYVYYIVHTVDSYVVFERVAQEYFSIYLNHFTLFIFQLRQNRIVHSYGKNITRKSTFEYELNLTKTQTPTGTVS